MSDRHDDTTPPSELDDDDREFLESVAYGQRRGFSPFDLLEHAMSGDDTTPPFAGHGFACMSEDYPLNASSRIQAMQRQIDVLNDRLAAMTNKVDEYAARCMRRGDMLDSSRLWLRVLPNCGELVGAIDAEIGTDVLSRIGK